MKFFIRKKKQASFLGGKLWRILLIFKGINITFKPNKTYCGLALELKVGYNKPTKLQKEWLKNLEDNNWLALCLNNYEEIVETIDKYLKNV